MTQQERAEIRARALDWRYDLATWAPADIRVLLDALDQAEAELADTRADRQRIVLLLEDANERHARVASELAEAKRDTARLDWRESSKNCEPFEIWDGCRQRYMWRYMGSLYLTLRAALDAAMSEAQEGKP